MAYTTIIIPMQGHPLNSDSICEFNHTLSWENYNNNIIGVISNNLKSKGYTFIDNCDHGNYIHLKNHIGSMQVYILIYLILKYKGSAKWYRTTIVEETKEINRILDNYFYPPKDIDPNWHIGNPLISFNRINPDNIELWRLHHFDIFDIVLD